MMPFYFLYPMHLSSTQKYFTPSVPVTIATVSCKKYIKNNPDFSEYFTTEERSLFKEPIQSHSQYNFIASRLSAKLAVSKLAGCSPLDVHINNGCFSQPIANYYGKPGLSLSITHNNSIGVTAAFGQDYQFGLDLERIQKRLLHLQNFSDRERNLIRKSSLPRETTATLFWTAKEALSKALLTGFTVDISIFSIKSLTEDSSCFITDFVHFPYFRSYSLIINEYVFTYVLPNNLKQQFPTIDLQKLLHELI